MIDYIENFFSGWHQIAALLSVFTVWAGFLLIGAVCGGKERFREVDVLVGWAFVSLLFVAGGVLLHISFVYLAIAAAAAALVALAVALRNREMISTGVLVKLLLLALPTLILVSGMRVSQWDEFTDWALIPRMLLLTDAFPSRDNPFPGHAFVAYPYSWHFVSYLAGRLAGGFVESTGPLMNTLLLYGYGLVSLRMIAHANDRPAWTIHPGWHLVALSALTTTLLNPTFAQKVAMTSYADVPTAVAAGAAAVLGWQLLEAMRGDDDARTRSITWQFALVLMLLINLKQATLVLFVLIVCATAFVGLRDRGIPLRKLAGGLGVSVVPGVLMYLLWRYHVNAELQAGEFSIRPFSAWYVDLIPQILTTMALVLVKKGYFLVLALAAVFFGIRGFLRSATPFDRLAAITALVVLGYESFLLFAYVASFGEGDALRAASFWRYNMHVGLIIVTFAVYGAALLWRRHIAHRAMAPRLFWIPIVMIIALPFVFAEKIRFDREQWVVHYRDTGAALAPYVEPGSEFFVFDPFGSGESGGITSFELLGRAKYKGYNASYHDVGEDSLRASAERADGMYIAVYSVNEALGKVLGLPARGGKSYLMKQNDGGSWAVVASWPHPAPGR